MIVQHLTADPGFAIDPSRQVIGWGVKNHGPCEVMEGVLYVSTDALLWADVAGAGGWAHRQYVAYIELTGEEGTDYHVLSDREILVINLDAVRVLDVRRER